MRIALLAVTLLMLSSCAVGPNFKPPRIPPTDRYTPGEPPRSFASGADVPFEWWKVYDCPALDALVDSALQGSPTVKAAQAALRQANELVKAQRATLFPAVQASYAPTRERDAVGTLSPTLVSAQPLFTLQTAQVSVSYMLDVFGGNRRQIESAQATAQAERYELEAAYLTLTSNVVAAAIQEAAVRAQIEANETAVRTGQHCANRRHGPGGRAGGRRSAAATAAQTAGHAARPAGGTGGSLARRASRADL
jgi:outer membrane protein TolC